MVGEGNRKLAIFASTTHTEQKFRQAVKESVMIFCPFPVKSTVWPLMYWRKAQQNETQSVLSASCFLEIYDSQHLSTDCISYQIGPQNKHNGTIGLEGKNRLHVLRVSLHVCQVVPLGLCFFLSLEISHSWLNLD